MRIGSLFSGIGGLDLGLERAGLGSTVWQVEADPYCRAVLAKHWPNATRHDDVRTVGAANLAPVDVICGGFPCQDISLAGKGAGLDGARSGLWFEYLRIVQEVRPRVVIIENVAALRTRGLAVVLAGLASAGYRAEWALAAARDVGAPHRRQRLFVVAVADALRESGRDERGERASGLPDGQGSAPASDGREGMADAPERGLRRGRTPGASGLDARDGEALAHGHGHGLARVAERDLGTERSEQQAPLRDDAHGRHADLADADSERGAAGIPGSNARQEGLSGVAIDGRDASARRRRNRPAETGLGRGSDGLSRWLDRVARGDGGSGVARWPHPPGPTQADWEPPRTAVGVHKRAHRLKALGNAVLPQVAEAVGLWAIELTGATSATRAA